MVHEPKKQFYKRFLYEPFPVESSLHEQVWVGAGQGGPGASAGVHRQLHFVWRIACSCLS